MVKYVYFKCKLFNFINKMAKNVLLNVLSELDKLIQKEEFHERSQQITLKYITDTTKDLNLTLKNVKNVLDQNQLKLDLKIINTGALNNTSNTTTHGRSKSKTDLSRNKPDLYNTNRVSGKTPNKNSSTIAKTPTKQSVTNLKSNAFKNEDLKNREKSGLKLNKTLTNIKENSDKKEIKEIKAPLTIRSKGLKDSTDNKLKNSQTITNLNPKHQKTASTKVEKSNLVKEKNVETKDKDKDRGISKSKNVNTNESKKENINTRQKTPGKANITKDIKDKKSIKEEVLSSVTSASSKMRINHLKENLMPKQNDEVLIDQTKMINIEDNFKADSISIVSKEKEKENEKEKYEIQTMESKTENDLIAKVENNPVAKIETESASEVNNNKELNNKITKNEIKEEDIKVELKNQVVETINDNNNINSLTNITSKNNDEILNTKKDEILVEQKLEEKEKAMESLNNEEYISDSTRKIKFIKRKLSNLDEKGIQNISSFLNFNEKMIISKINKKINIINLPIIKSELSEICNLKINEWTSKKQQILNVSFMLN